MAILLIIVAIALVVAAIYVYRNNEKTIAPIADEVAADEKKIEDLTKKI